MCQDRTEILKKYQRKKCYARRRATDQIVVRVTLERLEAEKLINYIRSMEITEDL